MSNHNNLEKVLRENDGVVSKFKEDRVKEGKSINKSLFFLTQVISMKSEGKIEHIPYRNSPLTKILKSSLGGNARTFIMLCITPMHSQYEQTLATLRFGISAKKIENKISANISEHNNADAYQLIINEYEERLKEMEKLRGADRQKVEYMIKTISELQKQKDELNEKLRMINKKRLLKSMKEKIVPDLKEKSEDTPNELYRETIGLIFMNKRPFSNSTNNYMNPLFDSKGVFAMSSFRNEKQKRKLWEEKSIELVNGMEEIKSVIKNSKEEYDSLSVKYVSILILIE